MNDFVFTTIAVGHPDLESQRGQTHGPDHIFKMSKVLINSILKYTTATILVITDMENRYQRHDRVIFKDIRSFTDQRIIRHGYFDFNLKRFAIKEASDMGKSYVIYLDADLHLNRNVEKYMRDISSYDVDLWIPRPVNNIGGLLQGDLREEVFGSMGDLWEDRYRDAPLPAETLLVFKNDIRKINIFIDTWSRFAEYIVKTDRLSQRESMYIGVGIMEAGMSMESLADKDLYDLVNSFNIVHTNKVMNHGTYEMLGMLDYKELLTSVTGNEYI